MTLAATTRLCVSGKISHPDQDTALEVMAEHRSRRVRHWRRLRCYHCPWCGGWHLTKGSTGRRSGKPKTRWSEQCGRWPGSNASPGWSGAWWC